MNNPPPPQSPISPSIQAWQNPAKQSTKLSSINTNLPTSNLASPPLTAGPISAMDTSNFSPGPRSPGNPSPPPSIARSSTGTNMYARSEAGWNPREEHNEAILAEHYIAFKAFLKGREARNQTTNNAKDKLVRLTPTQFYELSTDVFDELNRRQASARNQQSAPPHLMAQKDMHPKRNNARQTLASIGPPRFLNLAIDVFNELEKRFPRFIEGDFVPRVGSPMSNRGPSRTGTPVGEYPPRSQSRMRRPSNASSIRGPGMQQYDQIPPSPGLPNGDFGGRPMPKQFQSNTIVPNKSTMVEEDDDGSEADKKLIEDYKSQVEDLQGRIDAMENELQRKDEELRNALDDERSRSTANNMEKKELADLRLDLEGKLAAADNMNRELQNTIERMRSDHDREVRDLRMQLDNGGGNNRNGASPELQQENDRLRAELQQQAVLIEEVRAQARDSLNEMRQLSQQSHESYEKSEAMEKTVEMLQGEVREWQSRFTMAKAQAQDLQAASNGIMVDSDAARYLREQGLVNDSGIIRDMHITKFQVSIDEVMQFSHSGQFDKVNDSMKMVVQSVRRMTRDVDQTKPVNEQLGQQLGKLKAKVAGSANNFITAAKSFGTSAGMTPVSVLDAAVGNLTMAVVDLMKVAQVRPTPPSEMDEYDDGTMTPVSASNGFYSPERNNGQASYNLNGNLPPPPPFAGLGRPSSATSSAYSPVASPRDSRDPGYARNMNGYGYGDDELKGYLTGETDVLVEKIQELVGSIRGAAGYEEVEREIGAILEVVEGMISRVDKSGKTQTDGVQRARDRLLEARSHGEGLKVDVSQRGWSMWKQTLPPIAFEIAREVKEMVKTLDTADDEFS